MTETIRKPPRKGLRGLRAAAHFVSSFLGQTSHAVLLFVGGFLVLIGLFLTLTVYAAPLGVVLLLVGLLLVLRNVYA